MVDFNYDYDYSDIIDDIIDDSVDTSYTPPPRSDYSIFGDMASSAGGGISNLFGDYIDFISPSVLSAAGFNLDQTSNYPTLEDLISSGALSASNMAGMPDSSVSYGSGLSDYDFDFDYGFDPDESIKAIIDAIIEGAYGSSEGTETGTEMDDFFPYSDEAGVDSEAGAETNGGETETNGTGTETGIFGGTLGPKLKDMFGGLLGLLGLGGGNFLGSFLGGKGSGNPLIDYLMMKSLLKDQRGSGGSVPIGEQAYGQAQPFNYQDYQPTKLQPALLPGVGYGNAPGMMKGGEAKKFPNKGLAALAKVRPDVVQKMGYKSGGSIKNRPGDITFAKLEPGEFVIRREAVDAVGIPTLEQINSMGG